MAKIDLPDGYPDKLNYKFYYNEYGELAKTVYPTGAYDSVTYDKIAAVDDLKPPYDKANRGVTQRQLSASGSGSDLITWTYTVGSSDIAHAQLITTTAPDGLVTKSYRYALEIPTISRNRWMMAGIILISTFELNRGSCR